MVFFNPSFPRWIPASAGMTEFRETCSRVSIDRGSEPEFCAQSGLANQEVVRGEACGPVRIRDEQIGCGSRQTMKHPVIRGADRSAKPRLSEVSAVCVRQVRAASISSCEFRAAPPQVGQSDEMQYREARIV